MYLQCYCNAAQYIYTHGNNPVFDDVNIICDLIANHFIQSHAHSIQM